MNDHADELRRTVVQTATVLRRASTETAARPPGPGKWSAKQIVGHLIDSASNNHQRFIRAHFRTDLCFDGYDQDAWVELQHYQDADWPELIALWESFNLHLARVMEQIPDEVRFAARSRHNLDRLAFRPVPPEEPTTLDYFMQDYVEHLKHHLRQIDTALAPLVTAG
jgi:hypothetical protein